jgi:hypothetical protein
MAGGDTPREMGWVTEGGGSVLCRTRRPTREFDGTSLTASTPISGFPEIDRPAAGMNRSQRGASTADGEHDDTKHKAKVGKLASAVEWRAPVATYEQAKRLFSAA